MEVFKNLQNVIVVCIMLMQFSRLFVQSCNSPLLLCDPYHCSSSLMIFYETIAIYITSFFKHGQRIETLTFGCSNCQPQVNLSSVSGLCPVYIISTKAIMQW